MTLSQQKFHPNSTIFTAMELLKNDAEEGILKSILEPRASTKPANKPLHPPFTVEKVVNPIIRDFSVHAEECINYTDLQSTENETPPQNKQSIFESGCKAKRAKRKPSKIVGRNFCVRCRDRYSE